MPEKHRGRPTTDNPKTMRVDVRRWSPSMLFRHTSLLSLPTQTV